MIGTKIVLSFFAIIGMIVFGLSYAYSAEGDNLLKNGGFEDGIVDPWVTYGDVSIDVVKKLTGAAVAEDPIEGQYALHIQVNQKGVNFWDSGLQYKDLAFEKGKKYTLAAFVKSKKNIGLEINFKPELAQDPWTGYGEQLFTMTDMWQEFYTTTDKLADDVVPIEVTFHIAFEVTEFWMDGIRFFEGDYVPPEGQPQDIQLQGKLTTTWGRIKAE